MLQLRSQEHTVGYTPEYLTSLTDPGLTIECSDTAEQHQAEESDSLCPGPQLHQQCGLNQSPGLTS